MLNLRDFYYCENGVRLHSVVIPHIGRPGFFEEQDLKLDHFKRLHISVSGKYGERELYLTQSFFDDDSVVNFNPSVQNTVSISLKMFDETRQEKKSKSDVKLIYSLEDTGPPILLTFANLIAYGLIEFGMESMKVNDKTFICNKIKIHRNLISFISSSGEFVSIEDFEITSHSFNPLGRGLFKLNSCNSTLKIKSPSVNVKIMVACELLNRPHAILAIEKI